MASKMLFFQIMLASLLALHLKADGSSLPVIHVVNAVNGNNSPPIQILFKAGVSSRGSAMLKPNQSYEINVAVKDVYYATAIFGLKFTGFNAYEPARDIGHVAIYWKADDDGFAFSYDHLKWNNLAPWESE